MAHHPEDAPRTGAIGAAAPGDAPGGLELWGGVECTVNRVGDGYCEQLRRTGHWTRGDDDLERFAALGIRTLRYPVLWEVVAPDGLERADWSWADARMARLRTLGMRPIVGLVHHGSGPRSTSLLDPAFIDGLAAFAGAVAERYPWVRDFTPVNEPLTTARFAALYGYWYPHRRDPGAFVQALLIECRAIAAAMAAIRRVVPDARLVQTEDLGRTFSTPLLAYQAEHDDARRLLGFDLLCGRVREDHPLWSFLLWAGADPDDLRRIADAPCPPDVVGLNYYVTSDRLLDERLELYPEQTHGGNGRHRYADVEAVRAHPDGITGHETALRILWDRYRLPLAITEVQIGSTRDEQLRWLREAWDGACAARAAGADVRAVTVWSLLGAYDWRSLVVCEDGHYECGAFDVRSGTPHPTALARLVRALATGASYDHPALDGPAWWRRPERLLFGPARVTDASTRVPMRRGHGRTIVVTGATGTLGRAFARLCDLRGLAFRLLGRGDMDVADPASVAAALALHRPWAVVNTAGYVRVDEAERDATRCVRENTHGAAILALACRERGIRLLTFSSDLVFDGTAVRPYVERDPVGPLNVYGRSKADAERIVRETLPDALIVRTSAFFGPWDAYNFLTVALAALARGESFRAAEDAVVSPTYVPDLVHACLDLLIDGEDGVWHVANDGAVSWADLVRLGADAAGVPAATLTPCAIAELRLAAPRPLYVPLGTERRTRLPALDDAIHRYVRDSAAMGRG